MRLPLVPSTVFTKQFSGGPPAHKHLFSSLSFWLGVNHWINWKASLNFDLPASADTPEMHVFTNGKGCVLYEYPAPIQCLSSAYPMPYWQSWDSAKKIMPDQLGGRPMIKVCSKMQTQCPKREDLSWMAECVPRVLWNFFETPPNFPLKNNLKPNKMIAKLGNHQIYPTKWVIIQSKLLPKWFIRFEIQWNSKFEFQTSGSAYCCVNPLNRWPHERL